MFKKTVPAFILGIVACTGLSTQSPVSAQKYGSCDEMLHAIQVEADKPHPRTIPCPEMREIIDLCTDRQVKKWNQTHPDYTPIPLPSDFPEEYDPDGECFDH